MQSFPKPKYNITDYYRGYAQGKVGVEIRPLMNKAKTFEKRTIGQLYNDELKKTYIYNNQEFISYPVADLTNERYINDINRTIDRLNFYNGTETLFKGDLFFLIVFLFLNIFLSKYYSKDLEKLDENKNKKWYQKILDIYYNNHNLITITLCICIFVNLLFWVIDGTINEIISPRILYIYFPQIISILLIMIKMMYEYYNY